MPQTEKDFIKINEYLYSVFFHFNHIFSDCTGDSYLRGQKELPQLLQSHLQYSLNQI